MARLKATTLFFSTLLFIFLSTNAHAQIGKRIKERIKENTERKVEDKIVNKAGQKTDQALDSLFKTRKRPGRTSRGNSSSKSAENSGNGGTNEAGSEAESMENSGFNFGGLTNATYESSYTLDMEFKVEIKSQEKPKKKVETANMDMFYGDNCYMMVFKDEEAKEATKALMDLENNTSIVLNDEDMSGMAISMDFMTDQINQNIEDYQDSLETNSDYSVTKTGNTKIIAGYRCEEYVIETEDVKMNAWYTDEITVEMYQNLEKFPMFGSFSSALTGSKGQLNGTMMQSHMVEKTGDKGTFDYLVTEVNLTKTTLNMSDYTFMKL